MSRLNDDNNIGLIRYLLALGVIIAHFSYLTGADFRWPVSAYECVGGFFVLSGFLIWASYQNSRNTLAFFIKRFFRIYPPYLLVIIVAALLFSLVSTLTPRQYFTSPGFWRYLLCNLLFANFKCPDLPGVLAGTAETAINGSLWTIKIELLLYLTVPAVMWLIRKTRTSTWLIPSILIALSLAWRAYCQHAFAATADPHWQVMSRQLPGQLCYFYLGVLIYNCFQRFDRRLWLWFGASLLLWPLAHISHWTQALLTPFSIGLFVLTVSFMGHWIKAEKPSNNISYDIYLWHFPVIQFLIATGIAANMPPWPLLLLVLTITTLISIPSWLLWGRPAIRLARRLTHK